MEKFNGKVITKVTGVTSDREVLAASVDKILDEYLGGESELQPKYDLKDIQYIIDHTEEVSATTGKKTYNYYYAIIIFV